ncbi:hypothetical protein QJS10_CPB13g01212 [Acorus calamus]|uniref:GrpE protein homolog n=1 Tax=Acorus calamus TaxID=4465 RepID=A0AAV9DJI8_ACOCL|nr:hypothetical protein QJS10_CPB13g01212 [Acorus calamus]
MSLSTYGPPLSQTLLTPSKTLITLKSKSSLNPSSSSDRGRPPLLRTSSSFSSFGPGFRRRRSASLNVAQSDPQNHRPGADGGWELSASEDRGKKLLAVTAVNNLWLWKQTWVPYKPPRENAVGHQVLQYSLNCLAKFSRNMGVPYAHSCEVTTQFVGKLYSSSMTITGEEDEENVRGGKSNKNLPGLKILLESYKEAILDGDEKTVADIEAMIHNIERAKNELLQRSTELTTDVASERVNFLRLKADFENFRKRSDKDRLNLTSDAQREVLEGLLSIVDSFERSKQQIKLETEREKKINTSYQGIYKQFVEVMRSWRVSVVETVGKPFDPSLHEAIEREESKQFKAGIIIQELRRGFVVGDRLLRPADVKVSTGLGSKSAPSGVLQGSIEQTTEAAGPDGS